MPTRSLAHRLFVAVAICAAVASCDKPTPVNPTPVEPTPVTPTPVTPTPTPDPAPAIECPADLTLDADFTPLPVNYPAPVVTGGTAPLATSCSPVSGSGFADGTTAVTCTTTDSLTRAAQCTFKVNVTLVRRLKGTRFLAFGDSITSGEVAPSLSVLDYRPEQSYPSQLQAMLTARYKKQSVTVLNKGLYGEKVSCITNQVTKTTTCDSEDRLADELARNQPDALLFMEGTNDAHDAVSAGRVSQSLRADVDRAKNRGVRIVYLATIPPFSVCSPGVVCRAQNPADVDDINRVIRDVAKSQGAVLVDIYAALEPMKALLIGSDGMHPTELGQKVIAETFLKAIRDTFEEPLPSPPASSAPQGLQSLFRTR